MKTLLNILLIALLGLAGYGQRPDSTPLDGSDVPILIQKQIAIDELERQIRDTPMTAVRVFARLRIAMWLWSGGKDETGRAEELVTRAIGELYDKRSEIPPEYFDRLSTSLFVLLDRNSAVLAKKLRDKHNAAGAELQAFNLLPTSGVGDLRATNSAIKSITEKGVVDLDVLPLVIQLRSRNVTQYERLLTAVIQASTEGRGMPDSQVYIFADEFLRTEVPLAVQKAFARLSFERCRMAAYGPRPDTFLSDLLLKIMPTLSAHLPNLLPEASAVQAILTSRLSAAARASAERHDRISKSGDRLSAYLNEGDDVSDKAVKYEMYVLAAQLALKRSKFLEALKILGKVDEIDLPYGEITKEFRHQWRSSFLLEIVEAALKADEVEVANAAIRRIEDLLDKADMMRKLAGAFLARSDLVSAKEALSEAIGLARKEAASPASVFVLVRLLPVAQKVDPNGMVDLNRDIAKTMGALSAPKDNFESNPKAHQAYAKAILDINWNLLPVVQALAKANRTIANDLAGRIDNKEFRVVADLGLLIQSFDQSKQGGELRSASHQAFAFKISLISVNNCSSGGGVWAARRAK